MKNRNNLTLATVAAAGLALAGCASSKTATPTAAATTAPAPAAPAQEATTPGVGISVANIDPLVSPCDNFFQYASGSWLKNNPIPASEVRWGSFNLLADQNNAVMRQILQEAATNTSAAKGTNAQKVGDYYASGMDTVAIEKAGLKYLQPELARINAIKDLKGVQNELVRQQLYGTGSFFYVGVGQDEKKSTEYAVQFYQGGLSLPDRDYYLKDDARSKGIRSA